MKVCSKCGLEKLESEFHKNGFDRQGKQQYRGYCKDCANKKETERYWEKRELAESYNTKCEKCGEDRTYVLDFHHRNPDEKEFTLGAKKINREERLLKEIQKCVVLCANCHRAFHHLNKHEDLSLDEFLNN